MELYWTWHPYSEMYNVQCTVHLYLVLWALTAGHASNCAKNAVERKWCWWLRSLWCCQTRPWHWAPALVLWSLYIILTVVPTPTPTVTPALLTILNDISHLTSILYQISMNLISSQLPPCCQGMDREECFIIYYWWLEELFSECSPLTTDWLSLDKIWGLASTSLSGW